MFTGILGNHYVSLALALGSIMTGAYSFATALVKRLERYHAYIRRLLVALICGVGIGVSSYFFDKTVHFLYEQVITATLSIPVPNFTFGVASGVIFFLASVSSPFVQKDEQINSTFLLILYSFVAALSQAVLLPISAVVLTSHFHWFNWSINKTAVLIIAACGFILGLVQGWFLGQPLARSDMKGFYDRFGLVSVIILPESILTLILFQQIMGWGLFSLYVVLSFAIIAVLIIIAGIVEVLPTRVLVVLGVILVAIFAIARGYETIANSFH